MANEFARNVQDAAVNPSVTSFVLPSAPSLSTTSPVFDLGTFAYKTEEMEFDLQVPSLTSAQAPSGATGGVSYIWETSTTSAFTAIARTFTTTVAPSPVSSGVATQSIRFRPPSNCERYVRAKVTFGGTMGDASTVVAVPTLRF